ncbi:hypothetical protein SAMN04490244_104129 [Tranquillimonas rosea]|uniref:Uncharacterized protein n=1 Tax=Tranquillimonas rosea TaxID=641238 RepID=A0A1H9TEJ5_9RHOB|nr:HEPN domain-containing protein [Tranquillimonas rosea]SER95467.1 hypothetical protein SAMN04490244_104129 [Tranquillimonas rosea]
MHTTDDNLYALLERLPRSTSSRPQSGFAAASAVARAHSSLIDEIFKCLKNHQDLSYEGQLFFDIGQLHIHPYTGAISLAAYAVSQGPSRAINWYRGVINTESARIRHAGLISGLMVKEKLDFSNGVSILPFEQAGDSPQVTTFRSLSMAHPLQNVLGTHFNALAFKEIRHDRTEKVPKQPINHGVISAIEDVLIGCILNKGLAPALTVNWTEFLDPELQAAEASWGTAGFPQEAPVSSGRVLQSNDLPNIELFLAMMPALKEKMRVALSRVGLARRKHTCANKAIEYSIALEALLSDGNTEMTHKIATRAAIILGESYEERAQYRKLIKNLYKVRSRAVHGEDVSKDNDFDIIEESEDAISNLLLVAAKRGKEFDFDQIDLNGEV